MMEFQEFPKIPRLFREVIATEKLDGTNGQIHIYPADGEFNFGFDTQIEVNGVPAYIRAGSRNRWVGNSTSDDNNGFGRWVYQHAHELATLGFGTHYGEWWGKGIQRNYGLTEKRFSLFNVHRWGESRPECCHVVPEIMRGTPSQGLSIAYPAIELLRANGSFAAPGFMKPEGVMLYHTGGNLYFKATLEKDDEWKGKSA